jgi:hypothetical protein
MAQPGIVTALRSVGHEVYDFKKPNRESNGFHWSEIDGGWRNWTPEQYRTSLQHPTAQDGFLSDFNAMEWADTCVLVLPCGRSAHLEAGWFIGQGKPTYILMLDQQEPELMYLMASRVVLSMDELFDRLGTPSIQVLS